MINNSTVKNIKKELDTTKLRPLDLEKIEGSNLKFVNQTGWGPEINIEQTFIDILNYWRNN
jgi:GDP-4-dehydro-6-deoxy-D-mannose reductase